MMTMKRDDIIDCDDGGEKDCSVVLMKVVNKKQNNFFEWKKSIPRRFDSRTKRWTITHHDHFAASRTRNTPPPKSLPIPPTSWLTAPSWSALNDDSRSCESGDFDDSLSCLSGSSDDDSMSCDGSTISCDSLSSSSSYSDLCRLAPSSSCYPDKCYRASSQADRSVRLNFQPGNLY